MSPQKEACTAPANFSFQGGEKFHQVRLLAVSVATLVQPPFFLSWTKAKQKVQKRKSSETWWSDQRVCALGLLAFAQGVSPDLP